MGLIIEQINKQNEKKFTSGALYKFEQLENLKEKKN
jgi:hypothetical protein